MNMQQAPETDLRTLPQLDPPRDAWPDIQARLEHRGHPASRWLWAAAAAVLAISLGIVTLLTGRISSQQEELEQWMTYSRLLETQVQAMQRSNVAYRGHEALAVSELEDLIALIDEQLGQSDDEEELALWQQRALVLNDLMSVHAAAGAGPMAFEEPTPVVTRTSPVRPAAYEQ